MKPFEFAVALLSFPSFGWWWYKSSWLWECDAPAHCGGSQVPARMLYALRCLWRWWRWQGGGSKGGQGQSLLTANPNQHDFWDLLIPTPNQHSNLSLSLCPWPLRSSRPFYLSNNFLTDFQPTHSSPPQWFSPKDTLLLLLCLSPSLPEDIWERMVFKFVVMVTGMGCWYWGPLDRDSEVSNVAISYCHANKVLDHECSSLKCHSFRISVL